MNCCGSTPYRTNYDEKMRELRSINTFDTKYKDDYKIEMKLKKNFFCDFDFEKGEWNNDFNKEIPLKSKEFDNDIIKLNQKLFELENQCDELEKEYLAKTVRLLYMAQTHCHIKYQNDDLFERFGIKAGNKHLDLDKILPKANSTTIKIDNNEDKNKNQIQIEELNA